MTRGLNFTGVHSRRRLGRWLDWVAEVLKCALTLVLIVVMLSVALWSFLAINPLKEFLK